MNFDLKVMEKEVLLTLCLNNELYQSLIHICKEQKDYITPLIKLCGLRMTKSDDEQTKSAISNIIFWYLKECLLHHMVAFDDNEAYLFMMEQLITFIFIPSSLGMLFQASITQTYALVNMLFST